MVKRGSLDLKKLAALQQDLVRAPCSCFDFPLPNYLSLAPAEECSSEDLSRPPTLPRLFPACAASLRRAPTNSRRGCQDCCGRGTRRVCYPVIHFPVLASSKFYDPRHRTEHDSTVEQRQAQIFQTQLSPAELAHQETLIQERETEIREIETGIHELHEIFRDLGTIVQEQGEMLGSQFTSTSPLLWPIRFLCAR